MFAHFCRPARIFRPNVSVSALHLCRMSVSDICLSNKQLLAVSRGFITSPKMKETTRISWDTLSLDFVAALELIPLLFISEMPYRPGSQDPESRAQLLHATLIERTVRITYL